MRVSTANWCFLALVTLYTTLFFLPEHFIPRKFNFDLPNEKIVGEPFPTTIRLPLIESGKRGRAVTIQDWLAKSPGGVLVNFWATWCPPCLEELPSLEFFHRQLEKAQDPKLPILVTVSADEQLEDVPNLFKTLDFKPTFPVIFDQKADLARGLGTAKFPETYWVGKDGKILYKWIGPQDWLNAGVLNHLRQIATKSP